jgi:hypothetical protein
MIVTALPYMREPQPQQHRLPTVQYVILRLKVRRGERVGKRRGRKMNKGVVVQEVVVRVQEVVR